MPIDYLLNPQSRMITAKVSEPVTKKDWMDLFLGIKNHPGRIEGMDAVFNLTEHEVDISDHYIWVFARRMTPHITRTYVVKWAFVSSKETTIVKIDTFASYLMRNKNMQVRRFLNVEAARTWISGGKEERFRVHSPG